METLLWIVHLLVAIAIIGLVLMQHGKGADMGAAFGSGASGSLFGATGSANFLSRATGVLAAVFFITSLGLAYLAAHRHPTSGVAGSVIQQKAPVTAPAQAPATAPAQAPAAPAQGAVPAQGAAPATAPAQGAAPTQAPANGPAGSKLNDIPR